MTSNEMTGRDVTVGESQARVSVSSGRRRIAVIGIDRYRSWPVLSNAVRDAMGALQLFERLGFERVGEPLLDDAATGAAIEALVTDELMGLEAEDSLVVFFAGHGGTRSQSLGSKQIKTGYLIPVDAADGSKVATWIDLDGWLRKVARLPPRHILVVLDACFAGIALSPVAKWRDSGTFRDASFASLQARRSRRIITSALDDQIALDTGPISGHSLFTGCLIEGITQGRLGQERGVATGTELGLYLQQRVASYPHSEQTPDFGTFEHDDRGEMVIPLLTRNLEPEAISVRPPRTESLAIATIPGPGDGTGKREVGVSPRARWIAAVTLASILLVSSFAYVSFVVRRPAVVDDAGVAPVQALSQDSGASRTGSAIDASSRPGAGSSMTFAPAVSSSNPAALPQETRPQMLAISPPSRGDANAAGVRKHPPAAAVASSKDGVPTKRAVRAPPNRRLKPAVDERNCPVKGSVPVTIDSYPPGAMLYINHKDCGELGKTPWRGKLPSSYGTATGRFTAILERPGEEPVMQEFEVLKSTRTQRVYVRMPPRQ